MSEIKPWQSRYVFFIKEVKEWCPNCGAVKSIHYSYNDLTDDSGHYRACTNCDFEELLGDLSAPCSICNFPGSKSPHGPILVKLIGSNLQ